MKLNLQLFAVDLNTIAREVLAGKWGNGAERKRRLTEAGYNYSEVQSLVNSLASGSSSSPKTTTSNSTNSNPKPGAFTYDPYQESDAIRQAQDMLNQHMANKPGEYQSNWMQQINDTLDRILNREDFAYDLNGDALYQQYKDQYALQGQQAMMDVMGQAAAMNGGYGSSYAQTVGQQTYQGYLQQLNDKVPELYQLALNQYNQEGQDLYNQYGLYVDRENQDYSRYRDTVGDYYTDLELLTNDLRYMSETEYQRWLDEYNMKYGQHRDSVDDYWTQVNYDEAVRQYNASQSSSRSSGSGGSGSGGSGGTGGGGGGTGGTGGANPFTGSTYEDAVAYMKKNGVPSGSAAGMMTQSEWARRKASYKATGTGGAEVANYSSYKEYIAAYVEYQIEKNKK